MAQTVETVNKVDVISIPTVTITGTVSSNAGTNLNTSALALEVGGNLASTKLNTDSIKTAVEIIDNAISGNEMQVDIVTIPALSVGTNTIGKIIITDSGGDANTHDGHLQTINYYESISHSIPPGFTIERARGRKTGIGAGSYTLLEEATFIQPSTDTQMYIQSASANDTAAGTGIQQITIEYFSLAWGNKKTTTVLTNGVSQVALSVSDIYRIHKMYANRVGSLGNAAGLITLTNQATNILYGQISQYNAFMQRCIFYIGNGKRVTCTEGIFGSGTSGGVIGRLFASEVDASNNIVPRARIIFEVADSQIVYPFHISETIENPNNLRLAIGLAVTGVTSNQTATGTLKGFEEPL